MTSVDLRWTTQLSAADHADMAELFDSEYAQEWGLWNPKHGYGYAESELHALARGEGKLLGYASTARRFIGVGEREVVIAGIGGVLTGTESRGMGVGARFSRRSRTRAEASPRPTSACSGAVKKLCPSISLAASPALIPSFAMFLPATQ